MLDNYYLENCITNIQNNLEGLNSEDFKELIDIFENSTNEFVHSIICNKNNKEQLKNICHKTQPTFEIIKQIPDTSIPIHIRRYKVITINIQEIGHTNPTPKNVGKVK